MEDSLEHFIKLTRNTKEGQSKETQASKVSKQQLISAHKRIECESRASKIVEFLIEGKLRPEVFLRCLKHINQTYYQDVVEERAISKLCGYSLCDNQIPTMPAKQYFIDSRHNKVYDITERKNFCSNFCYRASLHIKGQIDNSPLWLRKLEESPKFSLLGDTERGSPGEEVTQGIVKPDQSFTSVSSFAEVSLKDLSNDEFKKPSKTVKEKLESLDEVEEPKDIDAPCAASQLPTKIATTLSKPRVSQTKKTQAHSKTKKDYKKIFNTLKKHVHEWMTLETYIFLYGEEQIKHHIDEKQLCQHFKNVKVAELSATQQKKYLEICKKLKFKDLVEDSFDKSILGFKIQPVPDYTQLKEDSRDLQLKVRSFYTGDSYAINENETKQKIKPSSDGSKNTEDDSPESPAVLPLYDLNSQNALRRKIYLNSISKPMLALTKGLHMPSNHILEELNLLVKTFRLQAHNVIFEPFLWTLIALLLIQMLSIRDSNLKTQLDSTQSHMFINVILSQLPNANSFFQDLFNDMRNIDSFLQRYFDNDA